MAQRINPREVVKALGRVVDAATGRDIVSLGCVKGVEVGEGRLTVALELPGLAADQSGRRTVAAAGTRGA